MTKAELVKEISQTTGTDSVTILSVIESFMSEVKSSLERGDEVTLRIFGTFCLKHRAEKVARNLSLNTSMVIPEHDIPSFKPSTEFLKRLK